MKITPDVIKDFIDKCTLEDFTPNFLGIIDNDELSHDIDEIISTIKNSIEENMYEEINNKIEYEIEKAKTDKMAKLLNIFHVTTSSIYNYILSKYYEEDNILKKVLGNIANYSFTLYQQIFSLYLSGCTMGILSQIRILYENYIIFKYIGKYPELAECYYDHAVYKKYILVREYNWKKLSQNEENEINIIEDKHGDAFADDYGWTYKIIHERNKRKIKTMVEDLKLQDYAELYKVSSNYIHPSSFSVFHTKIIDGLIPKYILSSIEIITNNLIHLISYYNCDDKDKILIRNVLYGLREDLYNEPKIYKS
jgi:hypothetical protein